jgi:hypothetical protein
MDPRPVRPVAEKIQSRFFKALNTLIRQEKIHTLNSFCLKYGLHKSKYYELRDGGHYKFIDIDALNYLVKDYGVSADWLITGKGKMFRIRQNQPQTRIRSADI